jgi:long-chain acyl-CoA synthetase
MDAGRTDAWEILDPGLATAEVVGPSGEASGDALRARALARAEELRAAGAGPGDPVAVVLPQDLDLVVTLLGCLAAGAVPLPLDRRLPAAEISSAVTRAGCRLVLPPEAAPPGPAPRRRPVGDALLLATSGTVGRPKVAAIPTRALRAIRDRFPLGPDQTFLAALPLAHAYGLIVALLAPLARGARVVVADWSDPRRTIAFASAHGATVMPAVPRMVRDLLRADLPDLGTIRAIVVGGAPARTEDLVALQDRYGVLVGYGYGMTETAAMTTLNLHLDEKPGSVGRPFPGVEVRIVGPAGAPAGPGEVGEVWLRDAAAASGYVDASGAAPSEEGPTAPDGWLRTGDLGFLDDEGYLTIVGRTKEIVITSGFNVVPSEVEEVLASHPDVEEAVVLGRPHPDLGEEVVAVVVPAPGADPDPEALRAHARARLAGYKVPREIRVERRDLPRTLLGKVSRRELAREVT